MDATELLSAEIYVVVTVGGTPLPGGMVEVELPMRKKNSYRFPVGPADQEGRLRITGDDLTNWSRKINALLLMDYVGLGAGWTGEVRLRPVGRAGIRRLRQAHQTWGHTGLCAGLRDDLGTASRLSCVAIAMIETRHSALTKRLVAETNRRPEVAAPSGLLLRSDRDQKQNSPPALPCRRRSGRPGDLACAWSCWGSSAGSALGSGHAACCLLGLVAGGLDRRKRCSLAATSEFRPGRLRRLRAHPVHS